jgi:signal transduction histidine kinase
VSVIGRLQWLGRHVRRQPQADIGIAAVALAVTLLTTATTPARGRIDTLTVAVAGVACGVLVLRRRHPLTVFLVSACAAEAYLAMYGGHEGAMILAAPLIALCTAAEHGSRRRALLIGVLAVLALAGVHMLVKPASWLGAENLALAAFGGLAVAAGDASRSRRAYLAEVEARARRAEADLDAEAARRVTDERLRIARDLHDVLGHQLALINVQAGVASYVLDGADVPRPAHEALAHIRGASKAALEELRDTIGLLRQPDEAATPTEPTTGLTGLPQLLASFRRAGLSIELRVGGRARPVPAPVDLTAYRIVQESLTNVCKHAGPCGVAVAVGYLPDEVRIEVRNEATGRVPTAARGNGLLGMRERVAALAGTLNAGPCPDGGFAVTASLPTGLPASLPAPLTAGGQPEPVASRAPDTP